MLREFEPREPCGEDIHDGLLQYQRVTNSPSAFKFRQTRKLVPNISGTRGLYATMNKLYKQPYVVGQMGPWMPIDLTASGYLFLAVFGN